MLVINIILSVAVSVMGCLYAHVGGLMFKGVCSFIFAAFAGVNLGYVLKKKLPDKLYAVMLFVGHVFSFCADIVINIEFIPGAALFAVAHVFYFIAFCKLREFHPADLICMGGIAIVSFVIILLPVFDYGAPIMMILCLAYGVIISCMLGKAISNAVSVRKANEIIIATGSFLFYFSDLMLLIDIFGGGGAAVTDMCLYTYYPAQAILALSVYLIYKRMLRQTEKD